MENLRRNGKAISRLVALWSCSFLAACSSVVNVDDLENRATVVNVNMAEYADKAILLNMLRARDRAPLSFSQLSQVEGHNTLTGSLGIPSISFGPHLSSSPRAYTVGPNTISRSFETDFTINAVDDPNTYSALFSPIDPKTIGLFAEQGYPREILFLLLTDHIRVKSKDAVRWITYNNDPTQQTYPEFLRILYTLLESGVTVSTQTIENNSATQVSNSPKTVSKLCLDLSLDESLNESILANRYIDFILYKNDVNYDNGSYGVRWLANSYDNFFKYKEYNSFDLYYFYLALGIEKKAGGKFFDPQYSKIVEKIYSFRNSENKEDVPDADTKNNSGKKKPAKKNPIESNPSSALSCSSLDHSPDINSPSDPSSIQIIMNIKPGSNSTTNPSPVTGAALSTKGSKAQSPKSASDPSLNDSGDTLNFDDGLQVKFVFRSAYGAYLYLGTLAGGKDGQSYRVPIFSVDNKNYPKNSMNNMGVDGNEICDSSVEKYSYFSDDLYFNRRTCGKIMGPMIESGLINGNGNDIDNINPDSNSLLQINRISKKYPAPLCFVSTQYGEDTWCVDHNSKSTKMVFGILHQLVQLYSNPSSQSPNTISVKTIQ